MDAPVVSVVIPCYNAGAWIEETVASVVHQRDVPLEVVLVDDGSDDDSVQIARSTAVGFPLTVIKQGRLGASRARNVGTGVARGPFIQYLDADDVLQPDTLKARLDTLASTGGDVAYCDWFKCEQQPDGSFRDGDVVQRRLGERPDLDVFDGAWWPPGALLYRRTTVDAIGPWREDLPIIQDARFLLDATLVGARFVPVGQVGLKYRSYPSSLSRRDPQAFLDDCYRNILDIHAHWDRQQSLDEKRRRLLVGAYAYLARAYFNVDRVRFTNLVGRLKALEPEFLPEGPPAFRAVSRVVGYPAAEHVAAVWRGLKATLS